MMWYCIKTLFEFDRLNSSHNLICFPPSKFFPIELYAPFVKLIKIGVPFPAIKPKMQAEGLDPDKLSVREREYKYAN